MPDSIVIQTHTFTGPFVTAFLGCPKPLLWQITRDGLACTQGPGAGLEATFSIFKLWMSVKIRGMGHTQDTAACNIVLISYRDPAVSNYGKPMLVLHAYICFASLTENGMK